MEQENTPKRRNNDTRYLNGALLITAGGLLLLYKMGLPIPPWIFSWQMLLIAIGIITGIKSNFENRGWIILILIGGLFLIDDITPMFNLHNYIVPIILIGVGIVMLKPKSANRNFSFFQGNKDNPSADSTSTGNYSDMAANDSEYLDINAIFGGVKKIVLSKNFQGGEVNTFMGGAEIILSQADIQQPTILKVNNVFGGTKIIVPSNWDVKSEANTVFGGIDDKRAISMVMPDPKKVLILKGSCLFGGIEIKNF